MTMNKELTVQVELLQRAKESIRQLWNLATELQDGMNDEDRKVMDEAFFVNRELAKLLED